MATDTKEKKAPAKKAELKNGNGKPMEVPAAKTATASAKPDGARAAEKGKEVHPDEFAEDGKMLVPVNRERVYRLIMPEKPKTLDPKFEIPETQLGRAARNYALLLKAEAEVKKDRSAAHQRLLTELRTARKSDMQFNVGRRICTLAVNHQDAKDEVKVKWA